MKCEDGKEDQIVCVVNSVGAQWFFVIEIQSLINKLTNQANKMFWKSS